MGGALGFELCRHTHAPASDWAPLTFGSWVPNHSHHKPRCFPSRPARKAPPPPLQGQSQFWNQWKWAWGPGWAERVCCHGNFQLQESSSSFGDLPYGAQEFSFIVCPLVSCQYHSHIFPYSPEKESFLRGSIECEPWSQTAWVCMSALYVVSQWAWARHETPLYFSFLICKMELIVELTLKVRIKWVSSMC